MSVLFLTAGVLFDDAGSILKISRIKYTEYTFCRSWPAEGFFLKGVLQMCSSFTGERQCRSVIAKKLECNTIFNVCSSFYKNTFEGQSLVLLS